MPIVLGAGILDVLGPPSPFEAIEQPFCIEIGTYGSFIVSCHELCFESSNAFLRQLLKELRPAH